MAKKFTVSIPDEPYKDSLTQNKSVEITYNGPNFLVITYNPDTNKVHTVDGYFNTKEEIDLSTFADDKLHFAIIDAQQSLLESSLLTDCYSHDPIDLYVETIRTGEEYTYQYSTGGILDDLFNRWELKYFSEKEEFSKFEYQKFPTTREQFMESLTRQVEIMTAEKEKAVVDEASVETLAKYDHVIEWCEKFQETYGDTDHWKIPFPTVK